ncbi:MAG: NAD-dependent epimerase/dehydratase family protein [Bacteroidales bacterium]|jgi:UDP-glucuronate 4-epimerase|nr:NAD-dependent epimerase/dehydratase family protein [Bacteroidales bacterium]
MISAQKHVLITGGAGFIGSHLAEALLETKYKISIIDNFDDFYNPAIKQKNIQEIIKNPNVQIFHDDLRNINSIKALKSCKIDSVFHLASKAGVRKSIELSDIYRENNIESSIALLKFALNNQIKQIIMASSSSVYGNHTEQPWHEDLPDLKPLSPYAQNKLECERLGQKFASENQNQFIALRFFSVFGPRMRPDLAMHRFTKKILNDEPIDLYGSGKSYRDYTYVSDIVAGAIASMGYTKPGFEVFNLGYGEKVTLSEMLSELEHVIGKHGKYHHIPMLKEESFGTWSDCGKAKNRLAYNPKTNLHSGLKAFFEWYKAMSPENSL